MILVRDGGDGDGDVELRLASGSRDWPVLRLTRSVQDTHGSLLPYAGGPGSRILIKDTASSGRCATLVELQSDGSYKVRIDNSTGGI